MKASNASSAQCRSSKTRTSGRCAATPSTKRRQAVNDSSRSDEVTVPSDSHCLRFDHLAERPVGDALPIGKRTALPPEDELGPVVDPTPKLSGEPRLADAGLPGDRQQLGRGIPQRARVRGLQQCEVVVSTDQRRLDDGLDVHAEAPAWCSRVPEL